MVVTMYWSLEQPVWDLPAGRGCTNALACEFTRRFTNL